MGRTWTCAGAFRCRGSHAGILLNPILMKENLKLSSLLVAGCIPSSRQSGANNVMQAIAYAQQQQQLQRQLMIQQATAVTLPTQPVQPQPAGADFQLDAPPSQANKKHRELYIGNLASGTVTGDMLRELFNSVLGNMVPDPIATPPILEVKMDPTGRGELRLQEVHGPLQGMPATAVRWWCCRSANA